MVVTAAQKHASKQDFRKLLSDLTLAMSDVEFERLWQYAGKACRADASAVLRLGVAGPRCDEL